MWHLPQAVRNRQCCHYRQLHSCKYHFPAKVSELSRGQYGHQRQIYRQMPGQLGSGAQGWGQVSNKPPQNVGVLCLMGEEGHLLILQVVTLR